MIKTDNYRIWFSKHMKCYVQDHEASHQKVNDPVTIKKKKKINLQTPPFPFGNTKFTSVELLTPEE